MRLLATTMAIAWLGIFIVFCAGLEISPITIGVSLLISALHFIGLADKEWRS